jgi:hypothetical protein
MDANVNWSRSSAAAIVVLLAALVCTVPASAQRYTYADDFSTDKAMTDSYFHSDCLQELPEQWPIGGFFMYEWFGSNRALSFYYGSAHDSYTWLKYKFPLDGSGGAFSSAVVELSLLDEWSGYGFIQCYCSLEGGSVWEWPFCSDLGPCTFEFSAATPSDTVCIWFRASDVTIDELSVVLNIETAADLDSWSAIKSLFGNAGD